ncbi:MAG: PilZ domain-containing protein [Gemmatimonadetes bacterium]|nr:PilZ domain-containing protein [Gemmatimonadota bacterium]
MSDRGAERRAHYRIVYPPMVQPRLELVGVRDAARVLDVSESGLRFQPGDGTFPAMGEIVTGRLRFHQRRQVDIAGEVVRIGARDVGVDLVSPGIPLAVIFSEQRHLMRLYPDGYDARQWEAREQRARALAEERGRVKIGELEARFRATEPTPVPLRDVPAAARAEPIEVHVVPRASDVAASAPLVPATPAARPSIASPAAGFSRLVAPQSVPVAYLALQSASVRDTWTRTGAEPPAIGQITAGEVRAHTSDELAALRREAEERMAIHAREHLRLRQLPGGRGRSFG